MTMLAIELANRPTGSLVLRDGSTAAARCSFRLRPRTPQGEDGLPQGHASLYDIADAALLPPASAAEPSARLHALEPLVGRSANGAATLAPDFAAGDLFVVQARALPGQEQAFVDFYGERHLAELLALDGFSAGVLYRVAAAEAPHRFVSLWALESAARAQQGLADARQTPGRIAANAASDRTASRSGYYERI